MSTSSTPPVKKGKGAPWARLAADWYLNGKFLAAGPDKFSVAGVYFGCVAYSRDQLTDGHIPAGAEYAIGAGMAPDEIARLFAKAVDLGLLAVNSDGGWRIPGYEKWQETAEQVAANRAAGAKRQADYRARQAGNAVSSTVTDGVSNGVTDGTTDAFVLSTEGEREGEGDSKNKSTAPRPTATISDEVKSAANGIAHYIGLGLGETPKVTKTFAEDVRKIIETDGRDIAEVKAVAEWLGNPACWHHAKIASARVFREKYLLLRASMPGQTAPTRTSTVVAFNNADMGDLGGAA